MTNNRYRHSSVKLVVDISRDDIFRDDIFRLAWKRLNVSPDTLEEVGGERQVWFPAQTAAPSPASDKRKKTAG